MTPLTAVAVATCLAVGAGSEHVTLRDLAPALSGWDALAPDTPVSLAPAPGVQRWFRLPELRRIAVRLNLAVSPQNDICVERSVAPLEPARLMAEMQRQLPDAGIEILEYSRLPVPEGRMEFPRNGLRQTPVGGFWTGSITYGGNHRFVIWARVKVLANVSRVVATEALKPGQTVQAEQLRVEERRDFPVGGAFLTTIEEAAGRIARRAVPAGTVLRAEWLDVAKDVARGDTVHVEVWSGSTHLEFEGEAEGNGSTGQSILVRNPDSKKRFLARVTGKGQVSVGKGTL